MTTSPKVLCFTESKNITVRDSYMRCVRNFPALVENKAWYAYANGRVFEIRGEKSEKITDKIHALILIFGNSFLPTKTIKPPKRRGFYYLPLYEFGLQELRKGCLIETYVPPQGGDTND